MHSAKIICDSIAPHGVRLTTMEVVFPRIILAEFNTHRMFSRNSASSRAIPVEKMLGMVEDNPYIPTHWGKNQKGMQAEQEMHPAEQNAARLCWLRAKDDAVHRANELKEIGLHKQITNRLLEPFMWHTVIVTGTEWTNFFHLRNNKDAHPDIAIVAKLMQEQYEKGDPGEVKYNQWHLPYIKVEDFQDYQHLDVIKFVKASAGKCARVSYLTHDGIRDLGKDIELCEGLDKNGHMSPLEHPAQPEPPGKSGQPHFIGNFKGWRQYRKMIQGEEDILGFRKKQNG